MNPKALKKLRVIAQALGLAVLVFCVSQVRKPDGQVLEAAVERPARRLPSPVQYYVQQRGGGRQVGMNSSHSISEMAGIGHETSTHAVQKPKLHYWTDGVRFISGAIEDFIGVTA